MLFSTADIMRKLPGGKTDTFDEDQTREAINIERGLCQIEKTDKALVEHADVGTEKEDIRDAKDQARDRHGSEKQRINDVPKRHVGALHQPREDQTKPHGKRCRAEPKDERVPYHFEESVMKDVDVTGHSGGCGLAEFPPRMKAVPQKKTHRDERQVSKHRNN
jgi:hypothetical protein